MLTATASHVERLIRIADALAYHARDAADELIERDEGATHPLYSEVIEEIECDLDAFSAVRQEIEGVQMTIGDD